MRKSKFIQPIIRMPFTRTNKFVLWYEPRARYVNNKKVFLELTIILLYSITACIIEIKPNYHRSHKLWKNSTNDSTDISDSALVAQLYLQRTSTSLFIRYAKNTLANNELIFTHSRFWYIVCLCMLWFCFRLHCLCVS